MERTAAVLSWTLGLGFGLPGLYGVWYLATRGEVWTFLGFPTYGGGPFERFGVSTTPWLIGAFVAVCAVECLVGWLVWTGQPVGWWLAVALLPLELVFWIGFALPFGPPLGIARAALALLTWP